MGKHKYNYRNLLRDYEINKVVNITDKYNDVFEDIKEYRFAYIYRIHSLVILGRFDDALILCFRALEMSEDQEFLQHILYFLSSIYYFKGEYILALHYNSLRDYTENTKRNAKFIIEAIVCLSNDKKIVNRLQHVRNSTLKSHVNFKHGEALNDNTAILNRFIKKNFYNAPTYYDAFAMYKIFRCNSIGSIDSFNMNYKKVINSSESEELIDIMKQRVFVADYLKVCFKFDNPGSILTMFPIHTCGDLGYYDISDEYFKASDSSFNSQPVVERRRKIISKFEARQSKKIN